MVGVPFTISRVQPASVWTRLAGLPAFSSPAERAMLKHAACAAAISSSGLVPGFPSKRVAKLYGPLKAPLPALKLPLPSLSFPSQTADARLVGMALSPWAVERNLAGPPTGRYACSRRPEEGWFHGHEQEDDAPRGAAEDGRPAAPAPAARVATPPLVGGIAHRQRSGGQHRLVPRHARLHAGRALGGRRPGAWHSDEGGQLRHHAQSGRLREGPRPPQGRGIPCVGRDRAGHQRDRRAGQGQGLAARSGAVEHALGRLGVRAHRPGWLQVDVHPGGVRGPAEAGPGDESAYFSVPRFSSSISSTVRASWPLPGPNPVLPGRSAGSRMSASPTLLL